MARGLGGDDGPSVFMVVAILAIFAWVKGWFGSLGHGSSGTPDNWANPIQPETTKQIEDMQKGVDAITYRVSNLKHPLAYYENIANNQYDEMCSTFNIDEGALRDQLAGLNADELKCVAKRFGVKDRTLAGAAMFTGTLFRWYELKLSDGLIFDDLAKMHQIWKKTGLW